MENNIFDKDIFLPLVTRVFSRSISGGDPEAMKSLEEKYKIKNRRAKIESFINNSPYMHLNFKDDPRYSDYQGLVAIKPMSAPQSIIHYLDYVYTK